MGLSTTTLELMNKKKDAIKEVLICETQLDGDVIDLLSEKLLDKFWADNSHWKDFEWAERMINERKNNPNAYDDIIRELEIMSDYVVVSHGNRQFLFGDIQYPTVSVWYKKTPQWEAFIVEKFRWQEKAEQHLRIPINNASLL